jgi:hypothetical protein
MNRVPLSREVVVDNSPETRTTPASTPDEPKTRDLSSQEIGRKLEHLAFLAKE